jgi:hypothetical protein
VFLGVFPLVFFSVSVFLCIFSLHDHDCSISRLHFHTLSYISCTKTTKYWYKTKTQSSENFKFHIPNLFYTVSAYLNLKKLGGKKIYNYLKTLRFSVFSPLLYYPMDNSRGEMGIFNSFIQLTLKFQHC